MSYRDQLTIFIKKHAGNITEDELKLLYFTDKDGKTHQFDSFEDEKLESVINNLVSCSWIKAEEFVKSFISKSGESRGPAPAPDESSSQEESSSEE